MVLRHRVGASVLVLLPLLASACVAIFAAPPRAPTSYCVHVQAMITSASTSPPDTPTFTSEAGAASRSAPADLVPQWTTLMGWTSSMHDADGWVDPPRDAIDALTVVVDDARQRCGRENP